LLWPRKYQQEGIEFLQNKKRAFLCDAPGLGKTLQAAMAAKTPVLIAAPTYLTGQWLDFLTTQYPNDTVSLAQGTATQRHKILNEPADWYIVNIEMLRSYAMPNVKTFIIDESHHVRGKDSQQSIGALTVAMHTERVYLLTATPICKEPDDLYMQLCIIDPRSFQSYWRFVNDYCATINTQWGIKIIGAKSVSKIGDLLKKYGKGRTYKDVGLQLPDLIEQRISVNPSNDFKKVYNKLKKSYKLEDMQMNSVSEALQTLRQMTACKEKTDALINLLEDQRVKQPTVVFCWYKDTAQHLGALLKAPVITGEIPPNERKAIAKKSPIVIATLASLSEGVDLSEHKLVIFFEEDYTPGIMYQALSRVRRHSADNSPVRAYTLVLKGTVDEIVRTAVMERIASVREILKRALS
jgi:superfamily II DNA or RNA helicase